jgi:PAS domain-containing protein
VAHVELSLTESLVPARCPAGAGDDGLASSLERWAATVLHASEPCLVVDNDGMIVAASAACHELLGLGPAGTAAGRFLLDGVLRLVDFTAAREQLTDVEVGEIPPLLAQSSGRLARGLMRVHDGADFDVKLDAIATPLCDGNNVVGSLTFFSPI